MKHKLFIVLLFIQGIFLFGQEPVTDLATVTNEYLRYYSNIGFSRCKMIINNGYLPLLDDTLHDLEIAVLNKDELRILRNTIYAKYGLIFHSDDLKDHFMKFDWYHALYNNVEDNLTNTDKRNINNILAFENAQPNYNFNKNDIIGKWLGQYPVASGDYNDIVINSDNTITFGYNTMYPKVARLCTGTYNIENGFLVVLIKEQKIDIGEYFHSGYASQIGGMENEIYGTLVFNNPIKILLPVSNLKEKYMNIYTIKDTIIRQIGVHDRVKL